MGKPKVLVNTLADIGIGITSDKKAMKNYGMAKASLELHSKKNGICALCKKKII